ncbi:MsnO8 family LLM class oxidoreductase, partial [Nocardia farcinica]|uniref:MsnO8 family LLM class oxidoreductase n=1 Tax=Nocardia farcinica TaxID=37329 RepID=UPI002454D249
MIDVPLSVLDLAPVQEGADPGAALAATTELARRTEELGYRRFWVAEHHNMPGIASSAPAVLIAHVAAATSRIRVGSGGVMLPNHAPLVVAEQFGTLHALHPGRIDLGIGRAPGTDQATARALRRTEAGLSAENFPQELADLYIAAAAESALAERDLVRESLRRKGVAVVSAAPDRLPGAL